MPETEHVRTVGVEEELLLVDAVTGAPTAVADAVLALAPDEATGPSVDSEPGGTLEAELQQQQIETDTKPCESLSDLAVQVRAARTHADRLAARAGGSSPWASHRCRRPRR